MRKKLLLILLITMALGAVLAYAIGTWHLLDNFTTADAAPLSDPLTTSGGQSVDVVDTEGTMSIAAGNLVVVAQASVVDGDMGLRYTTAPTQFAGRTIIFKVDFNTLANSATSGAEENNASAFFGFHGAADVAFGAQLTAAVRVTGGPGFFWEPGEYYSGAAASATVGVIGPAPTTTDSFYIAISLGGRDGGDDAASFPWYSGVDPSGYTDGAALWIKKNAGGLWLLRGYYNDTNAASMYPAMANLNSAFTVDRWAVTNDTLRALMQPIQYQSMTAADNTQLFDLTAQVGVPFDSIRGNFIVTSNAIHAEGSDPGVPSWVSTYSLTDDDVYTEMLADMTGTVDCSIVLRRDPGDGSFIAGIFSTGTGNARIFTFDGASFTLRASSDAFAYTSGFNVMGAAVLDSTVLIWATGSTENRATSYTGTTAITNIGSNNHGIRLTGTAVDIKHVRTYPLGTDGEYALLDQYLQDTNPKRGKAIIIQ